MVELPLVCLFSTCCFSLRGGTTRYPVGSGAKQDSDKAEEPLKARLDSVRANAEQQPHKSHLFYISELNETEIAWQLSHAKAEIAGLHLTKASTVCGTGGSGTAGILAPASMGNALELSTNPVWK